MQSLIRTLLRFRNVILILFLASLAIGAFAFFQLDIEAYPDPSPPMVEFITQNPSWSAEEMEQQVTIPLETGLNGTPTETSREAIKARYAKAFAQFPENKAVLKNRIAVGNTVVDHELVIRAPGGEEFEIIAIYTFKDGLIARVDFAK